MTPTRSRDAFSDVGGAERRFATTKPAVPPPRIRMSNSRDANSDAERVEAGTEAEATDWTTRIERRSVDVGAIFNIMAAMTVSDYTGQAHLKKS